MKKGNQAMFDWRQLKRWSIDEDKLPAGSIVRYRELSIWEEHRWKIVGISVIIFTQTFALISLLILVVPDILANAGVVTVSYFEWAQNIQQFRWQKDRVDDELTRKMREAYAAVRAEAKKENIDMRIAAFVLAIRRVGKAAISRNYVAENIDF